MEPGICKIKVKLEMMARIIIQPPESCYLAGQALQRAFSNVLIYFLAKIKKSFLAQLSHHLIDETQIHILGRLSLRLGI